MTQRKIGVLVVDDSPVVQLLLSHVINADPALHVVGTAHDGESALDFLSRNKPDVVLMDVQMPRMNGLEATRRIMETTPLPIIMCSANMQREEVNTSFQALDAGALAFVEKPVGPGHARFDHMVKELTQSLKLMSEVKVVRRWRHKRRSDAADTLAPSAPKPRGGIALVAIGSSTGGPPVIQTILSGLPQGFAAPVLIVQHIAAGFLDGMVEWLAKTTGVSTHMAKHGGPTEPGHVYLAPDNCHMGVGHGGHILLSHDPPESGLRPSVSYLFRSVAASYGPKAAGVLLSGMGGDGAHELKTMKERGAITIAQDAETCVVHGMPGEAIRLGAATYVLSPRQIAATLAGLVNTR
jgi:two-component system chemotaxis response regulator CheB